MGCFESKEERDRGLGHLAYECRETRYFTTQSNLPASRPAPGPYYGKYHCQACNRHWDSRFCWPDKYQICTRCRKQIYPYTYRELNSSDFDNVLEKSKEHQKELCQMCQQRGQLCVIGKRIPDKNNRRSKIHNTHIRKRY